MSSSRRVLVLATAGAGGDLQPLVAAALALRDRGHDVLFVGDRSVERAARGVDAPVEVLAPALDLGPRLIAAIREAMVQSGGDALAAGPLVRERMTLWARELARAVAVIVREHTPAVIATSLFGVEVLDVLAPSCPWAVVNSTFYVGPNPPRPIEQDFGPRAVPLMAGYAALLQSATLVLHATDRVFDFAFDRLPAHHRHVGPLGVWEPPSATPAYLAEHDGRWALVTISSQLQDDLPLAEAALAALAARHVPVVLTLGPDRDRSELGAVPDGVRVERTVSHAAVLERSALLVSHAGHGSVMKALWHGRPMVLVPWGRDQPGVAARAAALGVAAVVPRERAGAGTLGEAVDAVLGDPQMRERAERHGARLRATDPPRLAAELLEALL